MKRSGTRSTGNRVLAAIMGASLLVGSGTTAGSVVKAPPATGLPERYPSGEVIRSWNVTATQQAFGNPLRLSRILAIMHVAQHDAVNGIEARYGSYAPTASDPSADAVAAAAAAAHAVLVELFPNNRAALDARLAASLEPVPDGPAQDAGVAFGRTIGSDTLQARAEDGYSGADPFQPAPGPGVWEPTPPAFAPMLEPQFQNVEPFSLNDRSQFLPDPPPALTSEDYARNFDEVKLLGRDSSSARTADQTHLAHFWAEPSPTGWSRVGNIVSERLGYGLHETARLQALLNMSMADGLIVGWYQKRHFSFWRPVTAIRKADTDGNPATSADLNWLSLRPTPPLPDYPSTHSLLGAAAAEVLRRFTGTDAFSFCMGSLSAVPAGSERCWDSFTQAELENAESRVLVGFHFRFACETGVKVGRKVGKFTTQHSLPSI